MAAATSETWWVLCRPDGCQPAFEIVCDPPADVFRLCRHRRDEIERLIRLAENDPLAGTGTDLHIARTLVAAIDRVTTVAVDEGLAKHQADSFVAWLFRFRDAADRLDRVARVG